jgi:membrane-associated protease RseP (regulator of RpoE activity)
LDPFQEPSSFSPAALPWQPRPKFQDRIWLHVLLFVLTIATTTFVGVIHYLGYASDYLTIATPPLTVALVAQGLWYSVTILAILGCHELGHYFACRYYDVDASLPFFLPFPLLSLTGTLGAVIRIREPIPKKHMLFDIGIAGPIAGFLVAVPALFVGLSMSHVTRVPAEFHGEYLGEPLLFKLAAWTVWGTVAEGYSINMHPMGFAAWFGLLATVWNLFPAGQLDGGHISYALLGRKSSFVTLATLVVAAVLTYFSIVWLGLSLMIVLTLSLAGPHHPPVIDEDAPLDPARLVLAALALVIFIVCFTPAPISTVDLIGR